MKINDLISLLQEGGEFPQNTCDSVKIGDGEKEFSHIGITMMATVDIIEKARAAGCDLLITHEPTFYTHMDLRRSDALIEEKMRVIEAAGITVYRHHDGMHFRKNDTITAGMVSAIGLKGRIESTEHLGSSLFYLDTPLSVKALTDQLKSRLSLKQLRVAGKTDGCIRCLALCFGTPAGVFELLRDDGVDCVLTGEACEWQLGEYARDAAALGKQKSLVVMEHIASEKAAMRVLADELSARFPNIPITYFDTESVYTVV